MSLHKTGVYNTSARRGQTRKWRRQADVAERRLIIWRRDSDLCLKPESAATTNVLRCNSCRGWNGGCGVRVRLRYFSDPSGHQSECVRIGDGEPLLCRAAKERKDTVHLRSAAGTDLCSRPVSAWRIAAVLVPDPTSGAADGYLENKLWIDATF